MVKNFRKTLWKTKYCWCCYWCKTWWTAVKKKLVFLRNKWPWGFQTVLQIGCSILVWRKWKLSTCPLVKCSESTILHRCTMYTVNIKDESMLPTNKRLMKTEINNEFWILHLIGTRPLGAIQSNKLANWNAFIVKTTTCRVSLKSTLQKLSCPWMVSAG